MNDSGKVTVTPDVPLAIGDVLHGFCGGHFGRDHYDCCRIEARGHDWLVARNAEGGLSFAAGATDLRALRSYRTQSEWCHADPCTALTEAADL